MVANRQVTFSPVPASGTLIVIKRQTSTERLVSWQDASVLKASDMTLAQVQQLHILEEQQDWIKTNSMVTDDENRWNALNHRIINVSDPINDQDAVTKNYVENLGNSFKTLLDTTTTQDIQRLESKTQEGLAALDLQTTLDLETLKALSEEMKEIAKDVNVFIPSVTENIISWTNKAGLPNPDPVNIKGEQGSPGKDGTAATITIGTVTTGEPGSNASVTNVGTDTAAILDISIPRGDKGVDGTGLAGIATTEEAIAGESDTKAMTPLKTKEAVAAQVPEIMQETLQNKADLVDGKVPTNQLPEMDYVPNSEVGNAANKIPKYNASGHLVLPNGAEFWIG